jgi:hypothetical protein
MNEIPVYKITIDDLEDSGIEYVSLVERPAIQIKGLMFNEANMKFASLPPCHDDCVCSIDSEGKWVFGTTETSPCDYCVEQKRNYEAVYNFSSQKYSFKFNEDKQMVVGPAIIPDLKIYRYDMEMGEYYVTFERETIEKMVDKFNKKQKEYKLNLEHSDTIVPAFIKGSWIIEDAENDKSKMYGFTDLPVGTWFIEVKIEDRDFWMSEIKGKNRNGFSIEGLMGIKLSSIMKHEFDTYNDYPKAARDNACKVLRWRDEHGEDEVDGMTRVGWVRANQLCNGENISEETIARMSAFQRHKQNSEISDEYRGTPWKDRGYVAWLGWGGTEGIDWASRKLEQIRQEMSEIKTNINKKQFNMKTKKLMLRDYTLKNGAKITIEGDMAIGSYVYLLQEDGSRVQAPEGEHILEDGTTIFVDAEGYINEIRTAATTDVTEENEGMMMQVTPEEIMAVVNPIFDEMRMIIAELQSRIEMLEGKTDAAADILQVEDELKSEKFSDISHKINIIRDLIG